MMRQTWADDAVFYHIYPLGLCGAPLVNDFSSVPIPRLAELRHWIPRICDLGCNALYLGPVFESDAHGYDTADYFVVDRRLGTNQNLKDLCDELHRNNIKVVFDGVFNHVGRNFWPFKDLQENGEDSIYLSWFSGVDFRRTNSYGDRFSYDGWFDAYNLVRLNLQNKEVREHLFAAVETWIAYFGIDGIRLDVAEIIDKDFLTELATFCKKRCKTFWLMGEVIEGDYRAWANDSILDSTTNYEFYKALHSSHNRLDYTELSRTLERQFSADGIYKHLHLYNFADNHDTTRLASIIHETALLANVYTVLFTVPGIPAIYYGSEWAINGIKADHDDYALRPALSVIKVQELNPVYSHIRKLAAFCNKYAVLRKGDYQTIKVSGECLIFMRTIAGEIMIIALNAGPAAIGVTIDISGHEAYQFNDLLTLGQPDFIVENGTLFISDIPACGARILFAEIQSKRTISDA